MNKRGLQLVFLTAIISGFSIFLNSFGVKGIDATVFTFLKNSIVILFLLAIILGFREIKNLKKLNKKDWLSLMIIGLVGGSIPFVLFFQGLQMSSGTIGSFIHKTMFIFVAALAFIFLKEKISKKIAIPALLLLAGNFLLLKISSFKIGAGTSFILIATMFWAAETIMSKRILKTIEPKVLAFGRLFFGSLFIMAYMLFTNKLAIIQTLTMPQLSWIALTSVFLLLYVITWYSGLQQIKATTATSILLIGSPITTILSLIFLGKAITLAQSFGILLVLTGVIAIVLLEKPYVQPNSHLNTD